MAETDPTKCIARKKKFQAGFTPKNILISERLLDSAAEQLEGWLDKLAKAREAVEIGRWINYTAFDILGLVVFSEPFGFLAEGRDINGSIANARQLEVYIPVVGYFQWIHDMTVGNPIIDNWNLTPSHHIFDTARRAIKTSKEKPITGYDMMGRWLRWQQDNPDVHYEKTEIEAMAASVLSAGADTISATLQSLLYHLIRSPKHLERLRQEIDIAQSQTNPSKALSYDETQKLPFLRACVCSPGNPLIKAPLLTYYCARFKRLTASILVSRFLYLALYRRMVSQSEIAILLKGYASSPEQYSASNT